MMAQQVPAIKIYKACLANPYQNNNRNRNRPLFEKDYKREIFSGPRESIVAFYWTMTTFPSAGVSTFVSGHNGE